MLGGQPRGAVSGISSLNNEVSVTGSVDSSALTILQDLLDQYGDDLKIPAILSDIETLTNEVSVLSSSTDIEDLQTQLDAINNLSNTSTVLYSTLSSMSSAITTNSTNITTLNSSISTLASQVNTNTSNIVTNTSAIAALNSTVSSHTTSIAGNTSNIATLSSNLTTLSSTVTSQGTTIGTLNTSYIALQNSLLSTQVDVGSLTTTVGNLSLQGDLNSDDIDTLKSQVITLQAEADLAAAIVGLDTDQQTWLGDAMNRTDDNAHNIVLAGDLTTINSELTSQGARITTLESAAHNTLVDGGSHYVQQVENGTYGDLQAHLIQYTSGFSNRGTPSLLDTELVTWGLLKLLVDTVLPIGTLMMSIGGDPPSSFGGYITWAVYSAANGKYLKMTTFSGTVGTSQAASLLAHTHDVGTIAAAGTTTTGSGTWTTGADFSQKFVTNVSTGGVQNTDIVEGLNATSTTGGYAKFTMSTSHMGAHTHTVPAPTMSGTTSSSGTTNEVDSVYVLIYVRTA